MRNDVRLAKPWGVKKMDEKLKEERKDLVLERMPPGDRWSPVDNDDIILDSLTEGLEYVFQRDGQRDFHLAGLDGKIYAVTEIDVKPKPQKRFNLYGE